MAHNNPHNMGDMTVVTLQEPIPYRIIQKYDEFNLIILVRDCDARFDPKAPPSLTIEENLTIFSPELQIPNGIPLMNALLHCDKIYVSEFQTEFKTFPSKVMIYWNEYNNKYSNIMSYGTVLQGQHERCFAINHEEGYITETSFNHEDDIFQCWSTDVKRFCQRELPQKVLETIPRNRLEIGTVIQHDFLTLPRGSVIHEPSNLIILPSSLISCHLPSVEKVVTKSETTDFLLKISLVEAIDRDRFPQYLIASSVYWHCLHLKDKCQKISQTLLKWKFNENGMAKVMYYRESGIQTSKNSSSTNFKNTLFRLNNDVMLIRHDPITNEKSEPVVIKISKEKFDSYETMIGFEIDPKYLIDRWRLETEHDLLKAEYTMEPMNLLSHLRGIFLKMENEYYLDFLLQENSVRSTILESFMPDSLSNDRIYQIPNAEREARKDRRIKPGDSRGDMPPVPKAVAALVCRIVRC
uniref:Uncharacterized protein n=1 Tax=Panagrolaimus davidi TaxID=227884 RepID=A0A914PW94_9BILA